jgi:DNA primase
MPSAERRRSLAEEIARYHSQLLEGGAALEYCSSRGISQHSIGKFQLGFSGPNDNPQLANRLTIPYLTPAGPWHIKFRCLADHNCKDTSHAKYSQEAGNDTHLYNTSTLHNAERVIVVEGELDAVVVEQAGANAVAYPGADTWMKNRHWNHVFDSVDEVIVVADGDDAGRKAAGVVAESLRAAIPGDVSVVSMPTGHDSASFIAEFGVIEYLERVSWL